jgi:ADP-ribose pyrophosphatase
MTVRVKPVTHPGDHVTRYEIVERANSVAIVALRADANGAPEIALVSQRRPAVAKDLLEIPAGLIEPEEKAHPERSAARELREEIGCEAESLRLLVSEYPSPGYTTESISIYLASGLRDLPEGQQLDPGEQIEVRWIALDEAMTLVRKGKIRDGKTVLGIWLARDEVAGGAATL